MSKKIIEIAITCLLIIGLIIVVITSITKRGSLARKTAEPTAAARSAGTTTAAGGVVPVSLLVGLPPLSEAKAQLQKDHATKSWGRDPFQRLKTAEVGYRTSSLELKGISIGQDKKGYALINQEIVRVGDTIEGCKVLSIEKNRVLLQKGDQSFYLKLPEEEIVSPPQSEVRR